MAQVRIFNTLSRQVEDFVPRDPKDVGFYSCGPTVYAYPHIGNMRTYIFADTLRRTLEAFGYRVENKYVQSWCTGCRTHGDKATPFMEC